jgi:hypothetical protein
MNLPKNEAALITTCSKCGDEIELTPYAASLGMGTLFQMAMDKGYKK